MKKKPEVSFRALDGSGPLTIYWYSGPYGDAVEAKKGDGVVWLTPNGELLAAEFDDVAVDGDDQTLVAPTNVKIRVTTKKGKASVEVGPASGAA